MKNRKTALSLSITVALLIIKSYLLASDNNSANLATLSEPVEIVSIGGSVTETIFKLGMGHLVVGVDLSSTIPKEVEKLPQVGYIRRISSEGVLSMMPNLILTSSEIGPPNALQQLKNSGIDIKVFNSPVTIDEIVELVKIVSKNLKVEAKAQEVIKNIYNSFNEIKNISGTFKRQPKIAFFLNSNSDSFNAAGAGTNADYLIKLIGGKNVFSSDFKKYQKVGKEQILKYNPDIILVASHIPNQEAFIYFERKEEFTFLKALQTNNLVEVDMSTLSMGPGFTERALKVLKKINIEF